MIATSSCSVHRESTNFYNRHRELAISLGVEFHKQIYCTNYTNSINLFGFLVCRMLKICTLLFDMTIQILCRLHVMLSFFNLLSTSTGIAIPENNQARAHFFLAHRLTQRQSFDHQILDQFSQHAVSVGLSKTNLSEQHLYTTLITVFASFALHYNLITKSYYNTSHQKVKT